VNEAARARKQRSRAPALARNGLASARSGSGVIACARRPRRAPEAPCRGPRDRGERSKFEATARRERSGGTPVSPNVGVPLPSSRRRARPAGLHVELPSGRGKGRLRPDGNPRIFSVTMYWCSTASAGTATSARSNRPHGPRLPAAFTRISQVSYRGRVVTRWRGDPAP